MSFCVHVYVCLHKSFYVCVCAYICMRMSMRTFLCPCMTVYYVSLFAYVFLCLCLRLSVSSCGVFLLLHQRKHLNGYFASGQAEAVRFWSSINGGGGDSCSLNSVVRQLFVKDNATTQTPIMECTFNFSVHFPGGFTISTGSPTD